MENSNSYFGRLLQYICIYIDKKHRKVIIFTFVAAIAVFLAVHMYCFTNQLVNHDYALVSNGIGGMYNLGVIYDEEGGLSSGRFLLTAANSLSSRYTLPWFTGLLCALYFSLSMCAIVSLFEIKSRLSAALICVAVAAFPTAASTFAFMYTADAYFMALMLSCFGAYFAHKFRWGWLPASLLFAASLGIYQSYFCFGAALLVLSIIFTIFHKPLSVRDTIWICVRDLLSLALGLVLYRVVLTLILNVTGTQLSTYMGLDHMWYLPVWELGTRLSNAFRYTVLFYRVFPFYSKLVNIMHIIMLLILAAASVSAIIRKKIYKSPIKLIITVCLILTAPLACSLIWVMSGSVHLLMVYPVVLMSVAAIALLDKVEIPAAPAFSRFVRSAVCTLLLVSVLVQCSANVIASNKAYLKMDTVFKNAYAFCLKLSARIEATEGYHIGMPVMFIGQLDESNRPIQNPFMHEELEAFTGVDTERSLLSAGCIPAFCSFFLGDEITKVSAEQADAIRLGGKTEDMKIYPYPESIRLIDGVMVVKLGNEF